MRFFIKSDGFFSREETNDVVSISNRATNEVLYFNKAGKKLLDFCDKWVDLNDFVEKVNFQGVSKERVYDDFLSLLLKMEANGLCELEDVVEPEINGIKLAEGKDSRKLSRFVKSNMFNGKSCTYSTSEHIYDNYQILNKINLKYHSYIVSASNDIKSMMEFSFIEADRFGEALMLHAVVFDDKLSTDECEKELKKLLDFAKGKYNITYNKMRYLYVHESEDVFIDMLKKVGFVKKATFNNELRNGGDLTIYDYSFI